MAPSTIVIHTALLMAIHAVIHIQRSPYRSADRPLAFADIAMANRAIEFSDLRVPPMGEVNVVRQCIKPHPGDLGFLLGVPPNGLNVRTGSRVLGNVGGVTHHAELYLRDSGMSLLESTLVAINAIEGVLFMDTVIERNRLGNGRFSFRFLLSVWLFWRLRRGIEVAQ